jgi:hypothetical protein
MRSVLTAALLGALLVAVPAAARAQQVPNLSGTWVLQLDKSDFGPIPGPTSRTDVVDHQEPKLNIKRTTVQNGTEVVGNLVFVIDGKEYKNTMGPQELTSTLKWDGAVLVVSTNTSMQGADVALLDRYSLSADGKTLTQDRTISVQGQSLTQKLVFTKQ